MKGQEPQVFVAIPGASKTRRGGERTFRHEHRVWLRPDWFYAQAYDKGAFEAGWMPDEEAMAFMHQGLDRYLRGEPSQWP